MELLKKIMVPIQRQLSNLFEPKKEVPKRPSTRFTQLLELEALRKKNALREQRLNEKDLKQ